MRLPKIVGLVLCRALEVDRATGETSLVGVFNALRFRDWPSPRQQFTIYSALHGGVGEGTIKLVIVRLETEKAIHLYQRWVTLPGPGRYFNLVIPITRCVFPLPGRYGLTLSFDDQELSNRYLDVFPE